MTKLGKDWNHFGKIFKYGHEKKDEIKMNEVVELPETTAKKVEKILDDTPDNIETTNNIDHPAIVEQINNPDVVKVFENPQQQTSREVQYDLEKTDLVPGQKILVVLPDDFNGELKEVLLGHRKSEKYWNLPDGGNRKDYDPAGAYSEVKVFDKKSNEWKSWQDPKGYDPVKYAERRNDVEYENLHDWLHTVGRIEPAAVLIRSAGKNSEWSIVTENSVRVVTTPEITENTEEIEHIFSEGTSFVDLKTHTQTLPKYGGGKHEKHYKNAVVLGGKNGQEHFPMTENSDRENEVIENGQLRIKLPVGAKIKSLEVAIGDTWFRNGGQEHQLGWAKFNAFLKTRNGSEKFMDTVNIPPQGVLSGGPTNPEYVTQSGDEIILASQHTSYLMGYRVLYEKDENMAPSEGKTKLKFSDLQPSEKRAGGTQGGKWYENPTSGKKFFVKEYNGNRDRCASEVIANKIYEEMDVPAVKSFMIENKVATPEVKNIDHFPIEKKWDKEFIKNFYNHPDIKNGFIVDAWLANWDIFGLDYDNVSKTDNGRMLRIDAGGALFYRGMGQWKQQFDSENVLEIESMRNPNMAHEAGAIFQEYVTDEDIQEQVSKLGKIMTDEKITAIVNSTGISNAEKIIEVLIKRRNWLQENF